MKKLAVLIITAVLAVPAFSLAVKAASGLQQRPTLVQLKNGLVVECKEETKQLGFWNEEPQQWSFAEEEAPEQETVEGPKSAAAEQPTHEHEHVEQPAHEQPVEQPAPEYREWVCPQCGHCIKEDPHWGDFDGAVATHISMHELTPCEYCGEMVEYNNIVEHWIEFHGVTIG